MGVGRRGSRMRALTVSRVRWAAWLTAVAALAAVAGVRCVARAGAPADGTLAAGRVAGDLDSTCRASVRGSLSEAWVSLGESVVVRTRIGFSCPDLRRPYHLALVVGAAGLRDVYPGVLLADDLRRLDGQLALGLNRYVRAAVVAYASDAETLCEATNDAARLSGCLEEVAAPEPGRFVGRGGLDAGIRQGVKSLLLARGLSAARAADDPLREGLVVIEAGLLEGEVNDAASAACVRARGEVERARGEGIEVSVVCPDDDCAESCLAGAEVGAYGAHQWDLMANAQSELAWRSELRVARIDMAEALHRSLVLDPESVDYTAGAYDAREHGLTWHIETRDRAGAPLALSYALEATEVGTFPVRLDGRGVLVDTDGLAASFAIPQHELRVSDRPLTHLFVPRALQPPPLATQSSKPLGRP